MEIFKDIKGYEGMYQISNFGNVKSLERYVNNPRYGGNMLIKERILKPAKTSTGYYCVALKRNAKSKTFKIHLLISIAFLNHKPQRVVTGFTPVVDHIDNNKLNNRLDNLQVITTRENNSKDRKGSSKYTGVSWSPTMNKWMSCISINKKNKNLGYFNTERVAAVAYMLALKEVLS